MANRLGPPAEGVRAARDVHHVDGKRARGPGGDLTEDGLPGVHEEPLHVRESGLETQRPQHRLPHLQSHLKLRVALRRAQRDRLRADPLHRSRDQRTWPVPRDVTEQDLPGGAYGVVGELLAVDELFHADFGNVLHTRKQPFEFSGILHLMGVGRTGPGDGLDDQRVTDLLRRLQAAAVGGRTMVPRRTDAGLVEQLLHAPLVAERGRLFDTHAG